MCLYTIALLLKKIIIIKTNSNKLLMKKIFTLAFLAFFSCLSTFAEVELGAVKFSLGEGKKISPTTGKITISFPNATGLEGSGIGGFIAEGNFGSEETAFDGLEGSFSDGLTLDLSEFELTPSTNYTLTITSVKVGGVEKAPEGGYVLHFVTRGAERKTSWVFTIDEASSAQIVAEATANPAGDGEDVSKYMDILKSDSSTKRYYVPAKNYEEITLPDGSLLPMTEDLTFKFGNKLFYVGKYNDGSYKDLIAFNGNNQFMVIPDCQEGDVITFYANRATSGSTSKQTCIQAMYGGAIAPDGLEASTGVKDSIWLGSSYANFKFEVQTAGDITFRFSNCLLKTIDIAPGLPKVPRNYRVVAGYKENDVVTELKELVPLTAGTTGSTIKANYPYWVKDAEGNVYTHGSKSNEFVEALDLKNNGAENADTTMVISYTKTDMKGAAYLSEGEDIPGAILCTAPNTVIRSSMGKAGYVLEDTKLVTLQPGTYKIRAVLFDKKPASFVCTLTKGEGELNEIYLAATADNWTETESDLLTITEATDITLKAGGSPEMGLDIILIYASTDAPDDPDGIETVKSSAQKTGVRKVLKNGQILIKTENGTYNVVGAQVK